MEKDGLPPYDGGDHHNVAEKNEKSKLGGPVDVTLYHTVLHGSSSPEHDEITVLFPLHIALLRVWHSGQGVHGIEVVGSLGTADLFGDRPAGATCADFAMLGSDRLAGISLRAGLWIDCVTLHTVQGRSSPTYGNPTGGSFGSLDDGGHDRHVVGLYGERAGGVIRSLGLVTATRLADYRGLSPANVGLGADEGGASMGEKQKQDRRSPHRWDTGRLTRNRGIGVRWNDERGRLEIYQGSNDPNNY